MADKWSPPPSKSQNSKHLLLSVQTVGVEVVEHLGFREHLISKIPGACVEFQPEDQKVQIILKDSTTDKSERAHKILDDFLQSIKCHIYKVCLNSMKPEQLELLVQQIPESLPKNYHFQFDENEQMIIYGFSGKDFDIARQTLNDLLEKSLKSQSTSKRSVTIKPGEAVTIRLPDKLQADFICSFRDEFANFVLRETQAGVQLVAVEGNQVTFHGIPEEKAIEIVQSFLLKSLHQIRFSFKESVCFLVWDEPRRFVNKILANNGLKCHWSVDRDDMHIEVLACTENAVKKASTLIEMSVVHHSIPVPDAATRRMVRELLQSDFKDTVWCEDINSNSSCSIGTTENIWTIFNDKLKGKEREKMEKSQMFHVFKENVQMPLESKKHLEQMRKQDITDIESRTGVIISSSQNGWEVKGQSNQQVQKATDSLASLNNKLLKTDIISDSPKAKSLFEDKPFLQQLQVKHGCCTFHPKHGYVVEEPRGPLEKYCWFLGSQRVIQAEGKISEAHADILLCPVDDLFHPIGAGEQIVWRGGQKMSKYVKNFSETEKEVFSKIKEGDIHFEQATGFLKCHWIAYAVFPFTGGKMQCTEKIIKKMYQSVEKHAKEKRCRTVAMPVIFEDKKCKAFVKGIRDANKHWTTTGLAESLRSPNFISELILVTNTGEETEKLQKTLETEITGKTKRCTDWRHVKPLSEDEKIRKSPILMNSMMGSIVDSTTFEKTDMIVNSVDLKLEFDGGILSGILLKRLGNSVKEECKRKRPEGLLPGEVLTTAAGQYKTKRVCHAGMFPAWVLLNNFSLKVLKCIMLKCLEEADTLRLESVSFPTLGTGTLDYCYKKVAETMVGCVNHYGKQHPKTSIKRVNFIIYKDKDVIQAFLDAHLRIQEIPSKLILEGETKDEFPYLESADSTSACLLRILPKYPFEKMPLDFLFTLSDAVSTQESDPQFDKILNRFEKCVSTSQGLHQAVTSCLNLAIHHRASSIAFAFKTAEVKKQDIDTITTTFKSHGTVGQITACYILLEDMSAPDLRNPNEAEGQTGYLQSWSASFLKWSSSEVCWLKKEGKTADFFRKVHCLTIVTHMRDYLKPLTAELEGYLHRPLEWVLEMDGKKITASPEFAEELRKGYEHPSKKGQVSYKGKHYEFDLDRMDMVPLESSTAGSTVRISVKVDQDPVAENKQVKAELCLSDVFEDVTAEVNSSLEKLLQTAEMGDKIKKIGLSASFPNGHKTYSGKMEDIVRLDEVLRSSIKGSKRPARKGSQTEYGSNSENSLLTVTTIEMTNLEYQAVDFYMENTSLWQKASPLWKNGSLCVMTDTMASKEDANQLVSKVKETLKTLQSISWGEMIVEDEFKAKVADSIREVGQSDDFRDVFYHFNEDTNTIHIFSRNYNEITKAKHKIGLAIGSVKISKRRERRFGPSKTVGQSSRDFDTSSRDNKDTGSPHFPTLDPSVFKTSEGLVVKVYPGSILRLDVDCIVNAANGDLQHGGGVAQVISNAAGYEFERESRDYIYNNGPLGVGEVCTTSAGSLKYKGVIHAVGPRWYAYRDDEKWQCLDDLKIAVKNSLDEADIQKYQSIAIPAISSGIFGVPKEQCTQQYYRAIEEYSRSRGLHSTLTEVHFIDKDTQMCELIRMTFSKCFGMNSGMALGNSGTLGLVGSLQTRNKFSASSYPLKQSNNVPMEKDQRTRSLSSDDGSSMNNPERFPNPTGQNKVQNKTLGRSTDSKFCYQIGDHLTVNLVCGNIIEADTDAIVNPENEKFDGRGNISREIRKVAGEKYINELQHQQLQTRNHEMTKVFNTLAGDSMWKFVVHVVAPRWDSIAVKDPNKYEKNLKQSYENILVEMDRLKLDTLAMPVLGTGDYTHTTPYATIARTMVSVCKHFAVRIRNRKEVCVYCTDKTLLTPIKDDFDKEFCEDESLEDGQKNLTEPGYTDHDYNSKDKQLPLEGTENCCICIDTMTRPKKLSCGHVFCTECIDQQFKYKPACPQCGAVHGKITGDQPPGTMTVTLTKSYWGRGSSLPGYEGCGIINITYSFPSGKQGQDHPTPGKYYQGITRPGFLPDNKKGRLVAKLLRIAFDRKLVFTIGRSRTTGHDGVVTWNDIHHKTRLDGGPQAFGYPDPTYLDRVLDELKAKGVTEESLDDP